MHSLRSVARVVCAACWALAGVSLGGTAAAASDLQAALARDVRPLLARYCHECHAGEAVEGDVNLAADVSLADVRRGIKTWQRVREVVHDRQMPPVDAAQPSDAERAVLEGWLRDFLHAEAVAHAGDPGPVVLRRLDNAEYTYTIRDLIGVASLDPAREFPADGAAGEGFSNTGQALVMSPALVTKYLDAAKGIATHAVLLPDGLRFSAGESRADWTDENLARLREFYGRFTGPLEVSLQTVQQGIKLDMGTQGGLPMARYLEAAVADRERLGRGEFAAVARDRGLSPKYLGLLWRAIATDGASASPLLDAVRRAWRDAAAGDTEAGRKIADATVTPWQKALWKFNQVGQIARHLGRKAGPAAWMEPVTPLAAAKEFRVKLAVPAGRDSATIRLVATDAGDGNEQDYVVWQNPRLVGPGSPDLPLRDVPAQAAALAEARRRLVAGVRGCLAAVADAEAAWAAGKPVPSPADLASRHGVDPGLVQAWWEWLGPSPAEPPAGFLLTEKVANVGGHAAVAGWKGPRDLAVFANASDESLKLPGTYKARGVVVHPAPDRAVVIGWRSPKLQVVRVEGTVKRANWGCGNGVAWRVEVRRGASRDVLATGVADKEDAVPLGPFESVVMRRNDRICLIVDPRGGDHSCDSTAVDLAIRATDRAWNLAADLATADPEQGILAGNPLADAHGLPGVWELGGEATTAAGGSTIPPGSLLARWQAAAQADRGPLADAIERLLREGAAALPEAAADRRLHDELVATSGPILTRWLAARPAALAAATAASAGPDTAVFGRHPAGLGPIAEGDVCVRAPATAEFEIPAALAAGREFVVTATIHPAAAAAGTAQPRVLTGPGEPPALSPGETVIAVEGQAAWQRVAAAFEEFRELFPPAVCYARIVPVDEVITLNIFYREDDRLRRLLLDDTEAAHLDRLWDELLFVAQEPLRLEDVFEQLLEFATQDRTYLVSELSPMRPAIEARAEAFQERLVAAEPAQVEAVVALAAKAWRRPLTKAEADGLRGLYGELRNDGLEHEDAVRLLLARVLVAPAFLYKLEDPGPGREPRPVGGRELATRLSYFLWSSLPDEALASATERLQDPDVLRAETRRMLRDPRIRRLAVEFGTHWLHVYGFDAHDEKSAEFFPGFADLRGAMHEEAVLLLTDLFQHDRSILSLIDADHTFLNEPLAKHYGIPGVTGPEWRRVEGVRRHGRGGILTLAATLAKQSGASRTSPILRGTFFTEMLLGEKLPKPPKNVPPLAEAPPAGLSERELTALHSSDAACAGCHKRFDGYGFALEEYDAIGRRRDKDTAGKPIDAATALPDGTQVTGAADLRDYLASARGAAFERQFLRKLLGFALGRGVQLSDEPLLDEIQAALAANDHRASVAVEAIVQSPQFRQIRGREAGDAEE
jgi:hypothetical protein